MSNFPQDGYFLIQSRKNGTVLDVFEASTDKDARIVTWEKKDEDNDNQLWSFDDGFLINKKSGLVMDVRGGELKSGKEISQYDRKATMTLNQRFGYRDGYIYVRADPRLVIDVKNGDEKEGTRIVLNSRKTEDHDNQLWDIVPVA